MNGLSKDSVAFLTIDESGEAQRIDNFLLRLLKGVPKSHVYRILRGGEVRVNKKRVDQTYRLQLGDLLRIPLIRVAERSEAGFVPAAEFPIIYEDDALLAVNKPSGVAVHGGSGVSFGVIEQLRRSRPQAKFLELVHRLDRETSGVLLLAKKRSALTAMHEIMREGNSDKRYFALVLGQWKNSRQHVKLPLHKFDTPQGEKRVMVREDGQASHTMLLPRAAGDRDVAAAGGGRRAGDEAQQALVGARDRELADLLRREIRGDLGRPLVDGRRRDLDDGCGAAPEDEVDLVVAVDLHVQDPARLAEPLERGLDRVASRQEPLEVVRACRTRQERAA